MKANEPNFPDWAPKQVISEWREETKRVQYWHQKYPALEPETEEVDLLERLLTYADMRSVWERLPKYKIEPKHFITMVQLSTYYIDAEPHNLTPKKYALWLDEIKKTALKLKNLVEFSDYDRIFQDRYDHKRQKLVVENIMNHSLQLFRPEVDIEAHQRLKAPYNSWPDLRPTLLSDALHEICMLESDNELDRLGVKPTASVKLDKPNHPNAKRTYFMRKLTGLLREQTGSALRDIVTITTATAFDAPSLTERQVIRAAP